MDDQNQVPNNSIPPKVTPFSKPEGASPVSPITPRPITVRLKPVGSAPVPHHPAAPAPVTPPAAADPRVTAQVSLTDIEGVPKVGPLPANADPRVTAQVSFGDIENVKAPAAEGDAVPANISPRVTARVSIPELEVRPPSVPTVPHVGAATPTAVTATVRLRPVAAPGGAPAAPAPAPAVTPAAVSPLQPQHPPVPGSNPLPAGPKPASNAQVQASKSKTSRISLDSAIGVAPMAPMGGDKGEPKTIRLKRPSDLSAPAPVVPAPKSSTTPIRQTSRIPDSALPNAEAGDSAGVTQKKTLKIKRPGGSHEEHPVSAGAEADASAAAGGEAFPEGVHMTPVTPLDALPPKEESSVFTTLSVVATVAALIVLSALTWCLMAQSMGPGANPNTSVSVNGPELPWPGRMGE